MKRFFVLALSATVFFTAKADAAQLLVYDGGDNLIAQSLTALGYTYDLRNSSTPVTAADLASHEALVIGWNVYSPGGLNQSVLTSGITGNVLVTGHDADYHSVYGNSNAGTFLSNAVNWALAGPGTGLVSLGDYSSLYSFLPASYGLTASAMHSDTISSITTAGVSSGVYTGLTAGTMSNWGNAYHAYFSSWNSSFFTPYEYNDYSYAITLGHSASSVPTPEPSTFLLIGSGLLGYMGYRRYKNKA